MNKLNQSLINNKDENIIELQKEITDLNKKICEIKELSEINDNKLNK